MTQHNPFSGFLWKSIDICRVLGLCTLTANTVCLKLLVFPQSVAVHRETAGPEQSRTHKGFLVVIQVRGSPLCM